MKRDVKVPVYSHNRKLIGYIVYDAKTMLAWDSIEKTTAAYGDLHEGMGDGGYTWWGISWLGDLHLIDWKWVTPINSKNRTKIETNRWLPMIDRIIVNSNFV